MSNDANRAVNYDIENYQKYRPDYVPAIFTHIFKQADVGKGAIAVDIGSGPGNSAAPSLARGMCVFAVDPKPEMLAATAERFAGNDHFTGHEGSAQNTGLSLDHEADLVIAANVAILWEKIAEAGAKKAGLDEKGIEAAVKESQDLAVAEFRRVLKPGGKLSILYNKYTEDAPVNVALHDLLMELSRPETYANKVSRLTNEIGFRPEDCVVYFEDGEMNVHYEHYDVALNGPDELWGFLMAHTFFDQGKNLKDSEEAMRAIEEFFAEHSKDGVIKLPHYSCSFTGVVRPEVSPT